MGYCINCGERLPDNAKFCAVCGTKLDKGRESPEAPPPEVANPEKEAKPDQSRAGTSPANHCTNCGSQLPENAKYCFACDTKVDKGRESPELPPVEIPEQEKQPKPDGSGAGTAQTKHCTSCGKQLTDNAEHAQSAARRSLVVRRLEGPAQKRRAIPLWLRVAIGVCVVAMVGVLVGSSAATRHFGV